MAIAGEGAVLAPNTISGSGGPATQPGRCRASDGAKNPTGANVGDLVANRALRPIGQLRGFQHTKDMLPEGIGTRWRKRDGVSSVGINGRPKLQRVAPMTQYIRLQMAFVLARILHESA